MVWGQLDLTPKSFVPPSGMNTFWKKRCQALPLMGSFKRTFKGILWSDLVPGFSWFCLLHTTPGQHTFVIGGGFLHSTLAACEKDLKTTQMEYENLFVWFWTQGAFLSLLWFCFSPTPPLFPHYQVVSLHTLCQHTLCSLPAGSPPPHFPQVQALYRLPSSFKCGTAHMVTVAFSAFSHLLAFSQVSLLGVAMTHRFIMYEGVSSRAGWNLVWKQLPSSCFKIIHFLCGWFYWTTTCILDGHASNQILINSNRPDSYSTPSIPWMFLKLLCFWPVFRHQFFSSFRRACSPLFLY